MRPGKLAENEVELKKLEADKKYWQKLAVTVNNSKSNMKVTSIQIFIVYKYTRKRCVGTAVVHSRKLLKKFDVYLQQQFK